MNITREKVRPHGFTIVELLVVVSIIAMLIAILLPAIGKARDAARVTQSSANLRNLAVANDTYASDWADRQFTAVADDMGYAAMALPGDPPQYYNSKIACMPQQILGYGATGGLWGWWVGGPLCSHSSQYSLGNFLYAYQPMTFTPSAGVISGSYKMPNIKAFNSYVGNRWYDPVFWAPKDAYPLRVAEKYFIYPDEFTTDTQAGNQPIAFSSYIFSPAAMWGSEVLSRCQYNPPSTMPGSYRSPAIGQCRYPDLKTRMLEHHWLQNRETDKNPSFTGDDPSWMFNHGYNSKPVTMFFDGHVAVVGVTDAIEADTRAKVMFDSNPDTYPCEEDGETGLWHRRTPFGLDGYYGQYSYDNIVDTSYHILTVDGIMGRDVLGAK
jgi:prepilin-type N-terminal cleavage/methylation domain-containing protein